jgi:ferritin-like metal-binding protein YciE
MPKLKELSELLVEKLQVLYDTEKQQLKLLPKLVKAASALQTLSEGLQQHVEQTKGQVERLEQVFDKLGLKPKARKHPVVQALVEEATKSLERDAEEHPKLALLIANALSMEYEEIACYSGVAVWARQLGYEPAAMLLEQSLDEEQEAAEKLKSICQQNPIPEEQDSGEESEEEEETSTR